MSRKVNYFAFVEVRLLTSIDEKRPNEGIIGSEPKPLTVCFVVRRSGVEVLLVSSGEKFRNLVLLSYCQHLFVLYDIRVGYSRFYEGR